VGGPVYGSTLPLEAENPSAVIGNIDKNVRFLHKASCTAHRMASDPLRWEDFPFRLIAISIQFNAAHTPGRFLAPCKCKPKPSIAIGLELELGLGQIQTQVIQKPVLQEDVGMGAHFTQGKFRGWKNI